MSRVYGEYGFQLKTTEDETTDTTVVEITFQVKYPIFNKLFLQLKNDDFVEKPYEEIVIVLQDFVEEQSDG